MVDRGEQHEMLQLQGKKAFELNPGLGLIAREIVGLGLGGASVIPLLDQILINMLNSNHS
jgi:hypothetical protein